MHRWIARAIWKRKSVFFALVAPLIFASLDGGHLAALPRAPGLRGERTVDQSMIERQPVCIGSSVESAGELSDTLYYRAVDLGQGRLAVGYFAFFSEERPWGNNWMTWSVLPALAIDMIYSRGLLVAPGLQRALYGAGDVEGVGVFYDVLPDGSLRVDRAEADDETHRAVGLTRGDVLAIDTHRPTFYSDVWSHQLSGRGARSWDDLHYARCYGPDSIRPLPEAVAREFRIEDRDRAPPAHVDRAGGLRVDVEQAGAISALGPPPY